MAVRPLSANQDGTVEVWHDEAGHGGTVTPDNINFGRNIDGTVTIDVIELPCPVPGCGAVSWHPVTGGCDPPNVQLLFASAYKVSNRVGAQDWDSAKDAVAARIAALAGISQYRLETAEDPIPLIAANSIAAR